MENVNHYGQWGIALIIITVFAWFILKYFRPKKKIEWKNAGILSAFIIALYAEMYGFPLTIYILTSVFGFDIPFTHLEGHLWSSLLGFGAAGAIIEMMIGDFAMIIGGLLVITGWKKIYKAKDEFVADGIYKYMRHPQYIGIFLITVGALIHWPTIITLLMWPILTLAYYNLAKKEEKEMEIKFGETYQKYRRKTPMFLPSWKMLLTR